MINLNPLPHYLHIFQLENYKILRLMLWLLRTRGKSPQENKIPLVWTNKAKTLYLISYILLLLLSLILLINTNIVLSLVLIIIVWFNSYILLIISSLILKIYEIPNRIRVKKITRDKIGKFSNLKTIAITGSAGKTTTKNILTQILPGESLPTPLSFNTLFGISKVVDYELNNSYQFFIAEMGAYKKGDIKELCQTIPPDISILTTINTQHLERFGSINKTIEAKFEALQYTKPNGIGIVNLDNKFIRDNLDKSKVKLIGYSLENLTAKKCTSIVKITDWEIRNTITNFQIVHNGKKTDFQTNLLGKHHLSNLLAAITCTLYLEENPKKITQKVGQLKQIPHRLELKIEKDLYILDDTYSSNAEGFHEALDVLNSFNRRKILATPGIVELGKETHNLHYKLGEKAAKICDKIIIVVKSERTDSFKQGLTTSGYNSANITRVQTNKQLQKALQKILKKGDILLLENDLPEQYL